MDVALLGNVNEEISAISDELVSAAFWLSSMEGAASSALCCIPIGIFFWKWTGKKTFVSYSFFFFFWGDYSTCSEYEIDRKILWVNQMHVTCWAMTYHDDRWILDFDIYCSPGWLQTLNFVVGNRVRPHTKCEKVMHNKKFHFCSSYSLFVVEEAKKWNFLTLILTNYKVLVYLLSAIQIYMSVYLYVCPIVCTIKLKYVHKTQWLSFRNFKLLTNRKHNRLIDRMWVSRWWACAAVFSPLNKTSFFFLLMRACVTLILSTRAYERTNEYA